MIYFILLLFTTSVVLGMAYGVTRLVQEQRAVNSSEDRIKELEMKYFKVAKANEVMVDYLHRLAIDDVGNPQIEAKVVLTDVNKLNQNRKEIL